MSVELLPPGAPRDEWLAARRKGIGASEIAAVLGISPWDSPFSLYWRKTAGWEAEETEEMSTGTRVEPVVADWWADTHDPHENLDVVKAGLHAHPDRPWQLATPDRLIYFGQEAPLLVAVLECKWASTWDGWGEPGTDDIPVYYRAQVLWQCDVLGVDEWHVAVLGPGGFRAYRGRRDERDLAVMREVARRFMQRLESGDPPDVDEHTATLATLKRLHPNLVDDDAEISADTAALYRRARALRDAADRLAARAEARLRAEMGDRRRAVHDGQLLATRSIYTTSRIDTHRLRGECPDIAAAYTTETTVDRLTPARSK